jgi:Protein of unknown function (DUF3300)
MYAVFGNRNSVCGKQQLGALLLAAALLVLLAGPQAFAQGAPPAAAASATPPPENQPPPALTGDQLDQLCAPIALYPDALLAQVLMASAYPLDVVAADRFMQKNGSLTGDKMEAALANQPWDISVKTLTHFPAILKNMDDNLDWTQALGDAFVKQQADVMASIQRLRSEAYAVGNLKSSPQQTVTVGDNKTITIEPSDGQTVYVPQYDPNVVYTQGPATAISNGGTTTVVTQPSTTTVITQPTTTVVTQPGYSGTDLAATGLLSFGAGILVGSLINNNCDWNHGYVYAPAYNGRWSGWGAPPPGWHNNGWNNGIHNGNNNININNTNINGGKGANRPWKPDNNRRPSQGNIRPGGNTRPAAGNLGYGKGQPGGGGIFAGSGSNLGTQKNSQRGQQSLAGIQPGGGIKPGGNQPNIKPGGGFKPGGMQGGIKPGGTGGFKPAPNKTPPGGGFRQAGSTGGSALFGSGKGGGFDRNAGNRGGRSMGSARHNGFKPPAGGRRR